jgi:hypothetical protein
METAKPEIEDNNTIVTPKVSATKLIPNGAFQSPDWVIMIPFSQTSKKSQILIPRPMMENKMLRNFCKVVFCQKNNKIVPATN